MGFTGPFNEDAGDDVGKFQGKEQHGWAPDVGKEGTEEGHEATKRAFESQENPQEQPANS